MTQGTLEYSEMARGFHMEDIQLFAAWILTDMAYFFTPILVSPMATSLTCASVIPFSQFIESTLFGADLSMTVALGCVAVAASVVNCVIFANHMESMKIEDDDDEGAGHATVARMVTGVGLRQSCWHDPGTAANTSPQEDILMNRSMTGGRVLRKATEKRDSQNSTS